MKRYEPRGWVTPRQFKIAVSKREREATGGGEGEGIKNKRDIAGVAAPRESAMEAP